MLGGLPWTHTRPITVAVAHGHIFILGLPRQEIKYTTVDVRREAFGARTWADGMAGRGAEQRGPPRLSRVAQPPTTHTARAPGFDSRLTAGHLTCPIPPQSTKDEWPAGDTTHLRLALSNDSLIFFPGWYFILFYSYFQVEVIGGSPQTDAAVIPSRRLTLCRLSSLHKVHELAVLLRQSHHVLFLIPFCHSLVPCLRPS